MKSKFNKFFTLLAVLILGITNVWAEDFTITPITGTYLSPGNLVKITYSGDLKTSSAQIQTTDKNKSGVITLTTIAPGVYLKSASFTDANWSTATKRATLECTSGGSIVGVDGVYTFTASANATTATISITAGTSGAAKLGSVSLVVTNGTTNDIETYSTFAKTDDNFSFTAKCNGTSITPAAALSSSTWTVSSNNISAPSSNDSKTITISSANNIKFIAFYDSNCRLSIVEKSSSGGTCNGASWSVGSSPTKSVTFKNGISTSLTITKVFVITEAATNYTVTIDPNGGSYAETPDGWTYSAGVYTKSIASGTSFSAPAGLTKGTDDLTWKDGSDNPITFPVSITGDITFVAQWAPHAASSDATLSALSVAGCTLNETFDPATEDYTITLPFYGAMPVVGDVTATKNDPNAEDPEVSISGNVITVHCVAEDGTAEKDYTITVTIAPAPTASSSINIEQLVLDNGKTYDIGTALNNAHIGYVDKDALDSLKDQSGRNEPYLGLKFKKTTSKVTIIIPASTELNVKFGYIDGSAGLKVSVNGSAAAAPSLTSGVYTLAASAGVKEVVFTQTGAKTVVYKQIMVGEDIKSVQLPWLVTYDAGEHGTCATAKETWKGTALTLPAVTPESGWNFEGWNDDEDNPVSSPYTPTKNVTLTAQYSANASTTDLDALTYSVDGGAATAVGYSAGTYTYNVNLPYANYTSITVTPTPISGASIKDDATKVLTVSSLPGAATFTVVGSDAAEQLYTVNFTRDPKAGVSIIKAIADATNQDIKAENLSGLYKKAGHIYTSSSYKLDQKRYFMVQLEDGKNFQEGDVVEIYVSSVNDCNGFTIYSNISGDDFADGDLIVDTHDETGAAAKVSAGINKITLPSYAGSNKLYVARKSGTEKYLNAGINQVEVKRAMNPVLTAIQFNSTDVEVTSTTVAVLLPQGTNLGTMTVTPTIYWNGAGSAAPTAAWAWGANTYRVTDKDGDYTDYTITLTEDELKHNVSFNTHGGSAIDPVQVVDGGYLAPAQVPEDPTKDENVFKFWSETEDGAEVDITTVQINADKTFHAVWEAEPAGIKLINGDVVNHTNFLTGTKETTVEIESVEHKCVDFTTAGSNRTTVASIADLKEFIQYNATTNKAKIKLTLYNTKSSAVSAYLHMLEEGSETPTTEEISIPAGEVLKTDFYEFNSEKNRSFYITCGNRDYIKVLQVKVIDDGTTTLKKAGQVGYSVNTLKSRIFAPQQSAISFEGLTINANAVCKPLSTTALKIKNAYNISFHADAAMTLAVTTEGNQTYYVSATADGTANETSFTGRKEFNITAGDWYIHAGNSELKVAKLEFALPKAEEPTITTQPASNHTFGPGDLTATVEAEVSDGGTLKYQWYKASDDSEVTGQTTATLTTTTEGTYYVIVTNSLAGHQDSSIKSDEATLAYRDASDATLSALSASEGTLDPTFDPAELNYRVDLSEGTVDVPTLTATATMAGYASVVINNATAFVNYEAVSTVTVTSEDLTDTKVYTVHFYVAHSVATLVDVTENTTWDWTAVTKKKDGTTISGDGPIVTEAVDGLVIANYLLGSDWDKVEGNNGAYALRSDSRKVYQGASLHIHTTKGGYLSIWAANEGTTQTLNVANEGRDMKLATLTSSQVEYKVYVNAGDVTIYNIPETSGKPMRVSKMIFTVDETPDYTRSVSNNVGTLCVDHNVPAGGAQGATFYQIAGKNDLGKLVFEEVTSLNAGEPYIFQSTTGGIALFYGETTAPEPKEVKGMVGSYINTVVAINESNKTNIMYIASNKLWDCSDLVGGNLEVVENRAYIFDYENIGSAPAHAPGKRYIVVGKDQATGFDQLDASETPMKMIIDGQLFILRGEKMYNANGQLVK